LEHCVVLQHVLLLACTCGRNNFIYGHYLSKLCIFINVWHLSDLTYYFDAGRGAGMLSGQSMGATLSAPRGEEKENGGDDPPFESTPLIGCETLRLSLCQPNCLSEQGARGIRVSVEQAVRLSLPCSDKCFTGSPLLPS
jgi:hypothetical protein